MGESSQTQWSSLQEVSIDFGNPAQQPNPASKTSLGTTPRSVARWRVGAQRPVHAARRLRRGPDADARRDAHPAPARRGSPWFSVGLTWTPSETWEINGGYTRIIVDDPAIQLQPSLATSGSTLVGSYDSVVNLWGLSAQYRF
jgi:long-chain fatty acid transport protein